MEITRLHAEFAAEVTGCDLAKDLSADDAETLRNALDEHQVLVVRNQSPLAPDQQVKIASLFGPVVSNGDGRLWSELDNEDDAGAVKLPFHCDLSYTDSPIKVITLHAVDLPPGGTSTSFVSNVASWASLPADLQTQLAAMTLRHRHLSEVVRDWPEFVACHPLRMAHPRTERPMLFATEHHADRIPELTPSESDALLARIFAHIYAGERVYTHRWQPHDLVIWDNLASQHARREAADPAAGKRVVRRVVVNDATLPELIERARIQQQERAMAAN